MSKNKEIEIQVNGGNVNIGNVGQGDRSKLMNSNSCISQKTENDLQVVLELLEAQGSDAGRSEAEILLLRERVLQIEKVHHADPVSAINELIEEFGWAAAALKILIKVLL